MASITSTGVGSGLDVNTIVTSLMSLEKRPLTQLQTQASSIQTRLSAFGSLQGQLANLGDVAARLGQASAWTPMLADSTDSASVSATASASATAGSHAIEVQQLAQAQVLATGPYASSTTVVGTGTLTLEIGATVGGAFSAKSGSSPVAIAITAANQTLAGIRDAINGAKAGVTASIVTGSDGARLVLRGAEGAASSVRLTVVDGDGTATDMAGLSALAWDPAAATGAGRNLGQSQVAQDARFTVDGVALTSATNTPSDVLEGVALTLKKVTASPIQVGVSVQTVAVRKNVNDFVAAYNALNSLLRNQTQADPSGKSRGALQADSSAVALLNQLRTMLRGDVTGGSGVSGLAAAGIELQRDGSLLVKDDKLTPLLSKPQELARLFSQAQSGTDANSRGFGVRFKEWAKTLAGEAGPLASRVDSLKRSVTDNEKRQDLLQDRLERTEARLRAQYQRLDSQMSDLNARMVRMKSSLGLG
jgi:flagellar hook-associated protein 2